MILYFLIIIPAVVFIIGSGMYNKTAPQGNIIVKVCSCIGVSGTHQIYLTFMIELGGLSLIHLIPTGNVFSLLLVVCHRQPLQTP